MSSSTSLVTIGNTMLTTLQTTTQTNQTDYNAQIDVGKWITIPLVFFIILGSCLLPHILLKLKRGVATIIALCTCISGGAILGIGLMHILPHADEYWQIYLIPEECGGSHAGHNHNVISDIPIHQLDTNTFTEYNSNLPVHQLGDYLLDNVVPKFQSFYTHSTVPSPTTTTKNTSQHRLYNLQSSTILDDQTMSITQDINPIDPITLIPTPVAPSDVDCPTGHLFPWSPLCCGLVIMLLMAAESFLHTYLAKRGPNAVHLHDHGDGEPCGHGAHEHKHDDHHHHKHGDHHHQHGDHHHKDGGVCEDDGNCEQEVIELGDMERPSRPVCEHGPDYDPSSPSRGTSSLPGTPTNANDKDNKAVVPETVQEDAKEHNHDHHHDDETDHAKRTREIVEGGDVDDHGHKLTEEEQATLRFRRTVDAYISALAISLHCVFNGLSIGVFTADNREQASSFWTLFGATIAHKAIDGFAVGIPLMRANLNKWTTLIIAILVSISTPVGIIIGYFASNVKSDGRYLAQAILMSLSSGSFFYIALLELIPNGVRGKDWVPLKWLFVCIGFALSAVIAQWA